MAEAREYSISVRWIHDEGESFYRASVREFPDLDVYEDTPHDAYAEILDVIDATIAALAEQGSEIPLPEKQPIPETYSGRTTLRMSKSLHRRITLAAEADEVSLNQWITEAVAWRLSGAQTAPTVMAPNAISVTVNGAVVHAPEATAFSLEAASNVSWMARSVGSNLSSVNKMVIFGRDKAIATN